MKIRNYIPMFTLFGIAMLFLQSCGKDDTIAPVVGKVVDAESKLPVTDARIIYNANETAYSDSLGEFVLEYNLGNYLADSISLFISKTEYQDRNYSNIIGNTQKDIFLIELKRK